jgi:hypothetical protein
MAQTKQQGSEWVLLNDDGTPLHTSAGTPPPTFATEDASRKWAAANSVSIQGVPTNPLAPPFPGHSDLGEQYPGRPGSLGNPHLMPNNRWAFVDASGNRVPGTADYASEAEARALARPDGVADFPAGTEPGAWNSADPRDPRTFRAQARGTPTLVNGRWIYRDSAGNAIVGAPDFGSEADARAWDSTNPYYGGLTKEQVDRINTINADLGNLEGERRDASAHLADCVEHSVQVAQARVDNLRARTDALVAERARLVPAVTARDATADSVAIAMLRRGGWVERDGMWSNTIAFNYGSTHVSAGVTRRLDEAATMESQRSA